MKDLEMLLKQKDLKIKGRNNSLILSIFNTQDYLNDQCVWKNNNVF